MSSKPFITLDPSYNTYYIMSPYNPNIFLDYEMIDLKINDSTLSPIGTYKIPPIYLKFG